MSYEPPSQIYNSSTNIALDKLPLNDDVISIICSYIDPYLDPLQCIDAFWVKLGRETCNLFKWVDFSMNIIYSGFGKTSPYYKCLYSVSNVLNSKTSSLTFNTLRSKLDDMVCEYYPLNISKISNIEITSIFYNNSDCINYPYETSSKKRFPKVIKKAEKEYILNLIQRLSQYKYYIENYVINKILPERKDIHKELIKCINKFGKSINNLRIIEDIPCESTLGKKELCQNSLTL